jgi:hypothetical protein
MRLFVLLISVTVLMALVFFGLSVLLINIVGWLWPSNGKVGLHVGPRQAHKLKKTRPLEVFGRIGS